MFSPRSIDIAIVNYFSAGDMQRCLSVLGPWPHGTVWLVENSNDTQEAAQLREATKDRPWVRLLEPGANLGFGRGCNLAFGQSTSALFLLLNPDARIGSGDLLKLADVLAADPRIAAVSPRIFWNEQRSFLLPAAFPQTPAAGALQALASRFRLLAFMAARLYLARQARLMASQAAFAVDFLAGAVMMLRRDAVLAAGGLFDPDYFMFYEDSDLSLRLRRAGFGLAMAPAASAVHEYRHKAFKAGMMADSRQTYFRKRYPRFHKWAGLDRLARLARPVPLAQWFDALPEPCRALADFERQTGNAAVIAFSPSMLMMPALFRPGRAAARFDESEWALLEPAAYVALVTDAGREDDPRWVQFNRIA
ncbi:MAG: glycosyltransferase [Burkholderiales bacterium]|nr:glycosyltransferase [Burkholderiales bacterium]